MYLYNRYVYIYMYMYTFILPLDRYVQASLQAPRQQPDGLSKAFEGPRLRQEDDWKSFFRHLGGLGIDGEIHGVPLGIHGKFMGKFMGS